MEEKERWMVLKDNRIKMLVQGAAIAAIYTCVTLVLAPLSFGSVQARVSEALCVLPFFTPVAIPGLAVGCFLANLIAGYGVPDMVFGTSATLVAALVTYAIGRSYRNSDRKKIGKWAYVLAPLPPVLANAIAIGAMFTYVFDTGLPLVVNMLYIGAGQALSCYVVGVPLMYASSRLRIF